MVSKELKETLDTYHAGEKLRSLPLRRKMGGFRQTPGCLRRCSPSSSTANFIPRCPLFRRLRWYSASAWNIFLRNEKPLARKQERLRFPEAPGIGELAFELESLDYLGTERKFNSYLADFCNLPLEKVGPHQHQGVEFIFVLKGRLALKVGRETEFLDAGDSLHFDSHLPHGYNRSGTKSCSALVVTAE